MVICCDEQLLKAAKLLGYLPKIAPKLVLGEPDQFWLLGWLVEFLEGDLSHAPKLIAPKHFRDNPEDQYLTIVEALLGNPPRQIRRRYLYWLQLMNRELSSGSSSSTPL